MFDHAGQSPPPMSAYMYRLDALAAAEREWQDMNPGGPPLNWSLAPTSPDITFAEPKPDLTVLVFPARLYGGLLLSADDCSNLVPVLEAAADIDDLLLETVAHPGPLRASINWANKLIRLASEVLLESRKEKK